MIHGNRVRLRAPERNDIPLFVNWLNDPEVVAGLLLSLPLSTADEENWFDSMLKRPLEEHPMVIEFQDGGGWFAVGNCGFHNIDWRSRSAEVGIFIGEKAHWNRGIGTEAMQLLLKHGFQTLNLNRIGLEVFDNNPRAVHCYEKVGFIHEGRKRQAMYKNGQYVDVLYMSVIRSDWSE